MSGHAGAWRSGEDVQRLENVLNDTPTPARTRRALLERASVGLLAAGSGSMLVTGCGGTSSRQDASHASSGVAGREAIATIINTAITAEALAITYLSAVIPKAPGTPVERFAPVLKAANQSEYYHYRALAGLGAKPLTTTFWVPDYFFGTNLDEVWGTLEVAETLFVNAYLIATTAFAQAGQSTLARYAVEIGAVEAEHLALARFAGGKMPPNDLGFTAYAITEIGQITAALEAAGVGFGRRGDKPGKFVTFAPPPPGTTVPIGEPNPT
ncbi:MAG: hypothetical protein ACR2OB_07840 [Solirubrobacteraceae bacterium]